MHTYGNSLNICSIRNPSRSSSPAAAFPSSVYVRVLPRPRLRRSLRQQGRSRTVSEAVDIASSWLGDFELLLRHLALWSWPETGEIYENIWTYDEHWWTMSYVPWLLDGWHLENKQWTVEKQKQVGCQWSSSILQLNLWQKLLKTAWLPHPNCDTDSSLLAMVGKEASKPECTSKRASDKHTNNLLFLFVHKSPRFSSGFSISQVVCGYPGPERAWFILKWGEHPFEGDVGYWMFWVQCPFLYTYIYTDSMAVRPVVHLLHGDGWASWKQANRSGRHMSLGTLPFFWSFKLAASHVWQPFWLVIVFLFGGTPNDSTPIPNLPIVWDDLGMGVSSLRVPRNSMGSDHQVSLTEKWQPLQPPWTPSSAAGALRKRLLHRPRTEPYLEDHPT